MQPHEQRVIMESNELRERLTKLTAFISSSDAFKTLGIADQALLRRQRDIMGEYLDILGQRILRFP